MTEKSSPDSAADSSREIKARVTVFPRPDILDPQGKAIGAALERLGFRQVREVRAGKSFDVVLADVSRDAAGDMLEEMSRRLLANPVVEDFTIDVEGGGGGP